MHAEIICAPIPPVKVIEMHVGLILGKKNNFIMQIADRRVGNYYLNILTTEGACVNKIALQLGCADKGIFK